MTLSKFYLRVVGAFTLAFGIGYLLAPEAFTEPAGFAGLGPSATTDVRATYGGFQIGMGAFLLWAAQAGERHRMALVLVALSIGAVFFCRVIGLLLDGELSEFHRMGLVFEASLTAATILVLRKSSGGSTAPLVSERH